MELTVEQMEQLIKVLNAFILRDSANKSIPRLPDLVDDEVNLYLNRLLHQLVVITREYERFVSSLALYSDTKVEIN